MGYTEGDKMNRKSKITVQILTAVLLLAIAFTNVIAEEEPLTMKSCTICYTLNKMSTKFCRNCGFEFETVDHKSTESSASADSSAIVYAESQEFSELENQGEVQLYNLNREELIEIINTIFAEMKKSERETPTEIESVESMSRRELEKLITDILRRERQYHKQPARPGPLGVFFQIVGGITTVLFTVGLIGALATS
jgi:ribosomal protein L40E